MAFQTSLSRRRRRSGSGFGSGRRKRAHDLGEIGVRSRADQQLRLLVARLVGRAPTEPRPVPVAVVGQHRGLAHRGPRVAVLAVHEDAGDVAERVLLEIELLPVAHAGLAVHVREGDPREVRQVPSLAGPDEAHGHRIGPLVLGALVAIPAVLVLELLGGAGQTAAVLAHEPPGELQGSHSHPRVRVARVALRGHPEIALSGEVQVGVQRLEPRDERAPEPRIVERDVALRPGSPVLQAADHDRAIDEVDHRSGAKRGDELALPELAVGTVHLASVVLASGTAHVPLSSSCLNLSQTCTLGSTSRIDVGTWKYRASWSGGGSSLAVKSSDLPSVPARSFLL
jgi:hypothetical protein